jgi:uncharacterized ferredoxin-like protein
MATNVTLEEQLREGTVRGVAERMLIAARTAPKARGIDNLAMAVVDRKGIRMISDKLKEMSSGGDAFASFRRDATNILSADALVVIGTRLKSIGLRSCSLCGFRNCDEKDTHPDVPCVFNTTDLGIAVGSATSIAMENRVDNRVMYSVGQAAVAMNLLAGDVKIALGVPLSVSGKNPFFDRS